ncbi:MAG: HAMP domain-containing histidine kinase [Holosporaceae bacterium]|nr:HAMP domain-containing histidine kinase [Holosporaceae bacterium]
MILTDAAAEKVDKHGARYVTFGVFSLLNYTLPFFMWSEKDICGSTVVFIRITAAILSICLISYRSWEKFCGKYLPLFWYFTVMYSLSFSASYMLLVEGFSVLSTINILFAFMLTLIMLDLKSFLIIFPVGMLLAFILAEVEGVRIIPLGAREDISFQTFYVMFFSGIVAVFFSRDRERIEQEKMMTLREFGSVMAHEVRTPLSTILLLCKSVDREVQKLEMNIPKVISNVKKINREAQLVLRYIDTVLFRLNKKQELFADFEELSIKECITNALEQYFVDNEEKKIISFECGDDFLIKGNKHSVMHILHNLLQNAIYQIKSANRGEIIIALLKQEACNVLSFKDTASGVDPSVCSKLFSPMVTEKISATGLGLYFCKNAMEAMGGSIYCNTIPGKFAEFVLIFPKIVGENS